MSSRKRRTRRQVRRTERHSFRLAEKARLRGDKGKEGEFCGRWSGVKGMRGKDLPTEVFSDEALDQMEAGLPGTPVTINGEQVGVVTAVEIMDDWLALQAQIEDDYDWPCI